MRPAISPGSPPSGSPAARIRQLSGNDDMALGFNAMGGVGCISVTANVAPRLCADFQKPACPATGPALELQDRLYPLHAALFTDASPGPVKYALSRVRPASPPSSACR
jgi:4-hydroxy-tetrahydrodipicolinate synthase